MWMILFMLVGLFLLFFPLIGFFFPFLMIFMPLFFMFSRPSVKVYTRTFTNDDLSANKSSAFNSKQSLPNVIDADYTERDI